MGSIKSPEDGHVVAVQCYSAAVVCACEALALSVVGACASARSHRVLTLARSTRRRCRVRRFLHMPSEHSSLLSFGRLTQKPRGEMVSFDVRGVLTGATLTRRRLG